jgi:PAS domain-containing protein
VPQVEIRLLKQLASALATPMLVVSREGDLVFFNESAEPLIGGRFDEIGEIARDDFVHTLNMADVSGAPIRDEERPVIAALASRRPVHRMLSTRGLDGVSHELEGTGIPLISRESELLGGLALFWEPGTSHGEERPHSEGPHELEVILARRLAAHLSVPMFVVDADGTLLYFNDAAEPFFGRCFEELADVPTGELYAGLQMTNESGSLLKMEDHPAWVSRERGEPAHLCFSLRSLKGEARDVESTAIPLIGQGGELHGALGFFWELQQP